MQFLQSELCGILLFFVGILPAAVAEGRDSELLFEAGRKMIHVPEAHHPRDLGDRMIDAQQLLGNLIVDIQAKLRAGKGAGYERWATLHNLKQMAQTVLYLQEHKFLDYAELSTQASSASARFSELSAQIKAAEKRMAEIAVLRTHIINYSKTREVYVAYRTRLKTMCQIPLNVV